MDRTNIIGFLLCVFGGMLLSVQAGINGLLSKDTIPITDMNTTNSDKIVSSIGASAISFLVGSLALLLLFFIGPKANLNYCCSTSISKQPKWWYWVAGGFLGTIFVTGNTFLAPVLGSLHFVCMVVGQLLLSLFLDHINFLGVHHEPISVIRIFGAIATIVGTVVVAINRLGSLSDTYETTTLIAYMVIAFFNGFPVALQPIINNSLTKQLGTIPRRIAFLSFLVGAIILVIIWGITIVALDVLPDFDDIPWWYYIGGFLGAFYVTVAITFVKYLGVSLLVTCVIGGQLSMSIFMDHYGLLGFAESPATLEKIIGIVVVFIGVVIMKMNTKQSKEIVNATEEV